MPHWLAAILVFSALTCALGLGVFWGVACYRVWITRRGLPTIADGAARPSPAEQAAPSSPAAPPEVALVVPAHNEESHIERLIRSLRVQEDVNLRVVLALDRCTDRTLELASAAIEGDERFTIVEIDHCPEGWAGKVHAIVRGVEETGVAAADHLVFTDADCWFEPRALVGALRVADELNAGLLSVLTTLTFERWDERIVQPAAGLELARQYPLLRASDPDARTRRAFANGQFMLFDRATYEAVGGHAAAREALLEDIELARLVKQHDRRAAVVISGGPVRCAMYADWPEMRRGWKRIFTEAATRKPDRLDKAARRLLLTGVVFPAGAAAAPLLSLLVPAGDALRWTAPAGAGLALLIWLAGLVSAYRLGNVPAACALLHPIGAWRTAGILREAARDLRKGTPTTWGGREYARPTR
ncbi:MAG: glycosyltransferase [Planctomycetota bacterium]